MTWSTISSHPGGQAQAIERRLRPFRDAQVLDALEVHVVDHLAALVGETDPDVLLGLALAVRAPLHGHVCVDLKSVTLDSLLPESHEGDVGGALPTKRADWIDRVRSSALTREPDDLGGTPFVVDGSVVYSDRYFTYEAMLALALRHRAADLRKPDDLGLLARGLATLFEPPDDGSLDRQQIGAAMAALRGFTVVSGGPGTGKTYTVRSILTLLWAQWALTHDPGDDVAGPRVALAAPTGKAAARMKEALLAGLDNFIEGAQPALPADRTTDQLRAFLGELQPSTLHRLLGWNPANPSRFRRNSEDPLTHEIVIVDESSMVDFAMMAKLVDAVAGGARLILLGDKHQLASVEAGTALADICGPTSPETMSLSKQFVAELSELGIGSRSVSIVEDRGIQDCIIQLNRSRRFGPASGIGQFAKACLDAQTGAALAVLSDARFDDVVLLEHAAWGALTAETKSAIVEGYRPYLERLLAGPASGESDAAHHAAVLTSFDEFRVLCAHRNGLHGVSGLNGTVTDLLRREQKRLSAVLGRKSPLAGFAPQGEFWVGRPILIRRNDYVVGRYNGDVGIVVRNEDGQLLVAFPDDGGIAYLPTARLPEHETVFAMTVHKSQGSEFDHALVILPDRPSPVLTRELLYTGVTRAKRRMTLVSSTELVSEAISRSITRASSLSRRLWSDAPLESIQSARDGGAHIPKLLSDIESSAREFRERLAGLDRSDPTVAHRSAKLLAEYNATVSTLRASAEKLRELTLRFDEEPDDLQPSLTLVEAADSEAAVEIETAPRQLDADFTGTQPTAFSFFRERFDDLDDWRTLYLTAVLALADSEGEALFKLVLGAQYRAKHGAQDFSKSAEDLRDPVEIFPGMFAEAYDSAEAVTERLTKLLEFFGYTPDALVVHVTR